MTILLEVKGRKLWKASPVVFGPCTLVRTWGTHQIAVG
jgi:hypothetical protein